MLFVQHPQRRRSNTLIFSFCVSGIFITQLSLSLGRFYNLQPVKLFCLFFLSCKVMPCQVHLYSIKQIHRVESIWYVQSSTLVTRETEQLCCVILFIVVVLSLSCVPLFCQPVACDMPGPSVHGICQARFLEWVAISFSRGIFLTQGSKPISCISIQILYH